MKTDQVCKRFFKSPKGDIQKVRLFKIPKFWPSLPLFRLCLFTSTPSSPPHPPSERTQMLGLPPPVRFCSLFNDPIPPPLKERTFWMTRKLNWFLQVRNYDMLFQQKIHIKVNIFPRLPISLFLLAVMLVMSVRVANIWQPE